MLPPQPVSTTRETPTIAHTRAKLARSWSLAPHVLGTTSAPTTSRAMPPAIAPRTSGRWRSASGTGRRLVTDDQDDAACCRMAERAARGTRSAATMTTRNTASTKDGELLVFHRATCSMIPSPMPAPSATGRDSMRAITAAARAGSSTAGPVLTAPGAIPVKGALRMKASAASPPASIQTIVVLRRTGIPRSRARSVFSAAARTAVPWSVRRRNQASASSTKGATSTISISSPPRRFTPRSSSRSRGTANGPVRLTKSRALEPTISMPPSTWARPMLATVTTRRDASRKRRSTSTSTPAPRAMPPATPSASATPNGTSCSRYRPMASTPTRLPIAPWAKFTNRLAR